VRIDIRIANLSFTELVEAASWTVERVGRYSSHKGTSVNRDHCRRSKSPEVAAKLTSSQSESGLFGKCFIQASQGTVIKLANVIKTIIPKIQNNIMEKV
jgi:hypothetical protein